MSRRKELRLQLRFRRRGWGDGSINWLCWRRFDSAVVTRNIGQQTMANRASRDTARKSRQYRDGARVFETDFETVDG
jgi:hypothetical protein